MKALYIIAILLVFMPFQAAASSNEYPACTEARAGIVACLAGTQCECRWENGGLTSGPPSGWRWDCSTLRPKCGDDFLSVTDNPYTGPYPSAVGIDRSSDTTINTNATTSTTTNTNTSTGTDISDITINTP